MSLLLLRCRELWHSKLLEPSFFGSWQSFSQSPYAPSSQTPSAVRPSATTPLLVTQRSQLPLPAIVAFKLDFVATPNFLPSFHSIHLRDHRTHRYTWSELPCVGCGHLCMSVLPYKLRSQLTFLHAKVVSTMNFWSNTSLNIWTYVLWSQIPQRHPSAFNLHSTSIPMFPMAVILKCWVEMSHVSPTFNKIAPTIHPRLTSICCVSSTQCSDVALT